LNHPRQGRTTLRLNPTDGEAAVDASRLRTGEIVAGGGGIALFVFLFFDWFGSVGGLDGVSVDGWTGLGSDFTGFIVALSCVSGVALAVLAATGQRLNISVPRGGLTAALGSLTVLIILWRFFANPGDLKIGIFLGLAAAVAITVGALMALAEDGFQPLVAVASASTTTVAAATAPPANPSPPPAVAGSAPQTRSRGSSRSVRSKTTKTGKGSSSTKGSTTKRTSTRKRSSPKKGSSRSGTAKRVASTRSRSTSKSTTAGKAKSSRTTASKKSSAAKSRSSGSKRTAGSRKSSSRKK
jgi:hypothetical protein